MAVSQFSPKQVAEAMMVSESSIKRWCDRGLIPTVKTLGGHRRITMDALEDFLHRSKRALANPSALGFPSVTSVSDLGHRFSETGQDPVEISSEAFAEGLIAGDEAKCLEIIRRAYRNGGSIAGVADDIIAKSMRAIGDAWQCDDVEVYQERRGCEIVARLLGELGRLIPSVHGSAPIAIGCSPGGDSYSLASRLVEMVLRENGWQATSFGSDIPFDSLATAVKDCRPQLIWMSISAISNSDQFVDDFNRFAAELPREVILIVGGRALDDGLRPRLNYTAYCDNLRQLNDLVSAMRKRSIPLSESNN